VRQLGFDSCSDMPRCPLALGKSMGYELESHFGTSGLKFA